MYVLTLWGLIDLGCWLPTVLSVIVLLLSEDGVLGQTQRMEDNDNVRVSFWNTKVVMTCLTQNYNYVLLYSLTACLRILKFERRIQAFATIFKLVKLYGGIFEFFMSLNLVFL